MLHHPGRFPNIAALMGGVPLVGNDANTTVLLHFDGADASTTFTDVNAGGSAHTWTASGSAQLDTAQKMFGTASGYFADGTSSYISTPAHADWSFGSGDFTIDFLVRFENTFGVQYLVTNSGAAGQQGFGFFKSFGGLLYFECNIGGVEQIEGTTTVVADTWYHIAAVRTGNTLKLFINGTQEGGDNAVAGSVATTDVGGLVVGRNGAQNGQYLIGWIDELRVSKGIARWTSNFSVPSAAYG